MQLIMLYLPVLRLQKVLLLSFQEIKRLNAIVLELECVQYDFSYIFKTITTIKFIASYNEERI